MKNQIRENEAELYTMFPQQLIQELRKSKKNEILKTLQDLWVGILLFVMKESPQMNKEIKKNMQNKNKMIHEENYLKR